MSYECEELFLWCWWVNSYTNCCDIVSVQLSEYGVCYSFNSYSNFGSKFVNVRNEFFNKKLVNQGHLIFRNLQNTFLGILSFSEIMGVSESGSTQILEQSILAKTKNQESPL
jgi:hypothetical protein